MEQKGSRPGYERDEGGRIRMLDPETGEPVCVLDEVGLCYEVRNGIPVLLKHGEPETVRRWYENILFLRGCDGAMDGDPVYVRGNFDPDLLDRATRDPSALKELLRQRPPAARISGIRIQPLTGALAREFPETTFSSMQKADDWLLSVSEYCGEMETAMIAFEVRWDNGSVYRGTMELVGVSHPEWGRHYNSLSARMRELADRAAEDPREEARRFLQDLSRGLYQI